MSQIKRKRVDANQPDIVKALRRAGVRVHVMSFVGEGFPDLLTLFKGIIRLVEVKDGSKPPSRRKLTPEESEFALLWPVFVVNNEREALAAHGLEVA